MYGSRPSTPSLTVVNSPSQDAAKTNLAFVNPADRLANANYLDINGLVYSVGADPTIAPGCLGLNSVQRKCLRVSSGDRVAAVKWTLPPDGARVMFITAEVDFVSRKGAAGRGPAMEVDSLLLIQHLTSRFSGQIFSVDQLITFEFQGTNFILRIINAYALDSSGEQKSAPRGQLMPDTPVYFEQPTGSGIKVGGQRNVVAPQLFKGKEFNFSKLGIGGLDIQFEQIFRRAFASRVFPPSVVERLGIHHVKGVLLFGPPGTGKTLIARQIGKMLNGREPKVVNGPEILNKYVGASEENVRNLFADAEKDQAMHGEASELHVIIFDEIDAICKARGSVSSGSGVHDTVVNQLLTKIDGVDALNNILLIGMTNRKDMLDEALLRPGRLEVQIEIGLPDEGGRVQILTIHTSKMVQNSFIGRDVDLAELAAKTKNFSGAEIEGLVKSATSFALNRQVDVSDLSKPVDEDSIKVTMQDFETALREVKPAFGAVTETLETYRANGIIPYGERFDHLQSTCRTLVEQVSKSSQTTLLTALLEGPPGTGKTALAATVGLGSQFPFVKVISADNMVGFSETAKSSHIAKVFDDAYRSPLSIIVLDDIERLLEFVAIGPRFSNTVLQTLLVLLKKVPPQQRRLLVIGTTSAASVMQDMGVSSAFNFVLHVPRLREPEIKSVLAAMKTFQPHEMEMAVASLLDSEVPIKRILLLVDMARQSVPEGYAIPIARWTQVIRDIDSS
ncbi:hypothetical protein WJX84_006225 [Apatococcus fuscideae]|uniref:Vesicle-fusing ATPase n=1 Tax=Apatococcus fuscideae TaxID=2026836 RepID=A0AAW1SP76_9CHLO